MRSFVWKLAACAVGWQVLYFGWFLIASAITGYISDVGDGGCTPGAGC